jgi:hypothetical protein
MYHRLVIALLAVGLAAASASGCRNNPQSNQPAAERVTTVTVAPVVVRDLPIVESAVGMQSAVGLGLAYDPTRLGHSARLEVRLPFPTHVAERLRVGQAVTLSDLLDPKARPVRGRIVEILPALNVTTATREVIVRVDDPGWRPAGSVRGEVVLGLRRGARLVPEQAVVLRPAGTVVYVVEGERVRERPVRTGVVREGFIEILDGVTPGETVVVDGAALLSDQAKIAVRESGRDQHGAS